METHDRSRWYRLGIWLAFSAALSAVLKWTFDLAMAWNVSDKGGPDPFFTIGIVIGLSRIAALVFLLWGLARVLRRRGRFVATCMILSSLSYCSTPLLLPQKDIRGEAFRRAGERLMPVVRAIEDFHRDTGKYPDDISQLVPKYLNQLPSTGMGSYQNYRYIVGDAAQSHSGNPWILSMPASYGMGFDDFYYYPLQNYPENIGGEPLQRLGKWAYRHE